MGRMDMGESTGSSHMEGHDMGDMGGMDMGGDSASPAASPPRPAACR